MAPGSSPSWSSKSLGCVSCVGRITIFISITCNGGISLSLKMKIACFLDVVSSTNGDDDNNLELIAA